MTGKYTPQKNTSSASDLSWPFREDIERQEITFSDETRAKVEKYGTVRLGFRSLEKIIRRNLTDITDEQIPTR